jgi:hypothetical protein
MFMRSVKRYEEIQGQTRGVLILVADQLPQVTVGIVSELIDHNESGIAVEMLSEMLVESDAKLSVDVLDAIARLVNEMGLDQTNVERLRPLLRDQWSSEV